jgi:hypothetical protein
VLRSIATINGRPGHFIIKYANSLETEIIKFEKLKGGQSIRTQKFLVREESGYKTVNKNSEKVPSLPRSIYNDGRGSRISKDININALVYTLKISSDLL